MKIEKALSIIKEAKEVREMLTSTVAINKKGTAYIVLPHPYVIYSQSITLGDVVEIIKEQFPEVTKVVAHFRGKCSFEGHRYETKIMSLEEEQAWAKTYFSRSMLVFPSVPALSWAMEDIKES